MLSSVRQHQILNHEFHVDDAARVVFKVEQVARVRVSVPHFSPHLLYFDAHCGGVALLAHDLYANPFELAADTRVAAHRPSPRQRLVFPQPCLAILIIPKCLNTAYQQTGNAVRPQSKVGFVEHWCC